MKTRILTAAVLLPLFLIVLLALPPWTTAIVLALLSALAVYEFLETAGFCKGLLRIQIYSAVTAAGVCIWSAFGCTAIWGTLIAVLYFGALFYELLLAHTRLMFPKLTAAAFSAFAIPYLLSSLTRILQMNNGRFYVLVPLIMAFASDTGAYFVGHALGRRKLAPLISPKKTLEGFIGGIFSAAVMMLLYALILRIGFRYEVHLLSAALYGIVGSLCSVGGDLTFSAIKRQSGIKDYGTLFPGHGGVLDRFDSVIAAAPVAELLIAALPMIGEKL